jgi:hypothetical protein
MPPTFEHFLHRARRHWTAWTILEHAALGLLFGSLCVLLLLPILLWRSQPNQSLAILLPSLGLAIGALAGLRARPSLRDVAHLADARFNTADLLSTALALRGSPDPPDPSWHTNILLLADHRAATLSPAALTPHRLGTRAWSAIVLSTIAAATLGLFSITLQPDRAQALAAAPLTQLPIEWAQPAAPSADSLISHSTNPREAKAETTPDSQSTQSTEEISQATSLAPRPANSSQSGQSQSGNGGGSARTDSAQIPTSHHNANLPSNISSSTGTIAVGGLGPEGSNFTPAGTTLGTVSNRSASPTAPWSTPAWPAAQSAAQNAINTHQIPDAYRDLVRDYFTTPDADHPNP